MLKVTADPFEAVVGGREAALVHVYQMLKANVFQNEIMNVVAYKFAKRMPPWLQVIVGWLLQLFS